MGRRRKHPHQSTGRIILAQAVFRAYYSGAKVANSLRQRLSLTLITNSNIKPFIRCNSRRIFQTASFWRLMSIGSGFPRCLKLDGHKRLSPASEISHLCLSSYHHTFINHAFSAFGLLLWRRICLVQSSFARRALHTVNMEHDSQSECRGPAAGEPSTTSILE